jgi:hypothetical protein
MRLVALAVAVLAAGCAAPDAAPTAAPAPAPASAPEGAAAGKPEPSHADAARSAAAFERLRGLAGTWKGEFGMGESKTTNQTEVRYRVTSGGSAVEEVLFGGTDHEMVTMYHLDGPRLLLTHYCAAGNQPTMVLLPGDDPAVLRFDFLRATNLKGPDDGHMHEAVIELPAPDRLRATWTYWEGGKPGHAAVIESRRAEAK